MKNSPVAFLTWKLHPQAPTRPASSPGSPTSSDSGHYFVAHQWMETSNYAGYAVYVRVQLLNIPTNASAGSYRSIVEYGKGSPRILR